MHTQGKNAVEDEPDSSMSPSEAAAVCSIGPISSLIAFTLSFIIMVIPLLIKSTHILSKQ